MHPFNRKIHRDAEKRGKRLKAMLAKGMSVSMIAVKERVSRQRISQILRRTNGS